MITTFEKLINKYLENDIEIDMISFDKKFEFCYNYLIYKGYNKKDFIELELNLGIFAAIDLNLLIDMDLVIYDMKKSLIDKYYLDASEVFEEVKEYSSRNYDLPMCLSNNFIVRCSHA